MSGLGVDYVVRTLPDVDESYPADLAGAEIPEYISREKADAYRSIMQPGELLITADTIVWLDGKVLGKPEGREGAVEMLRSLSGKSHQVFTGVCLTTTEWQKSFTAASDVEFDVLSEEEIRYYVDKYQPMDKAGAYGEWETFRKRPPCTASQSQPTETANAFWRCSGKTRKLFSNKVFKKRTSR